MTDIEQEIVTSQMIKGFNDCAKEACTSVTGGQTVFNPYPMIGGCAIATPKADEFMIPTGAKVGDKLVLTKPLGM
jgi:selenide,water dikinase